tara:strand:+ start:2421 stop:2741 length:321 start_codon:yes stop_codon:yes gene_type:complete
MKNIYGKDENLELYNNKGLLLYKYHACGYYSFEHTCDNNGNALTYKNSTGVWGKYTRDSEGKELTYENSKGIRRGFEQEKFTKEEILKKFNRLSGKEFYKWISTKG